THSRALLRQDSKVTNKLFVHGRQAPIAMRLCPGQASTELTLLSRQSSTSWTTNRQCYFLLVLHDCIVQHRLATSWSILISPFPRSPAFSYAYLNYLQN